MLRIALCFLLQDKASALAVGNLMELLQHTKYWMRP